MKRCLEMNITFLSTIVQDHDDCARGASLDRLPRVGVTVGSQFAPPTPSHNHTVLVDLSRLDVNKVGGEIIISHFFAIVMIWRCYLQSNLGKALAPRI